MSSPTPPFTTPAATPAGPLAAELARTEADPRISMTRSRPPEEVLAQMTHADAINARLLDRGFQIRFSPNPEATRLQIELRDAAGTLLRILSAEEAVEIAVGRPLG